MRSAENVLWRVEDRRRPSATPTPWAPKSFSRTPAVFAPHPPLASGGWYSGTGQETAGAGRVPLGAPADRSAVAALLLTLLFGPLGLGYLSRAAGVLAGAASVGLLVVAGVGALAVLWPLAMVVSVVATANRH